MAAVNLIRYWALRKVRLEGEGRWLAFKRRREELKAEGLAPARADKMADKEFAPLDVGADPVIEGPGVDVEAAAQGRFDEVMAAPDYEVCGAYPNNPKEPPDETPARASRPGRSTGAAPVKDAAPGEGGVSEPVANRVPPLPRELLDPGRFRGGDALSWSELLEWAASQMQVAGLKPEDAPSATAWALLVWARSDPLTTTQFWQMYAKLAAKVDDGAGAEDAEADLCKLIETVAATAEGAVVEAAG